MQALCRTFGTKSAFPVANRLTHFFARAKQVTCHQVQVTGKPRATEADRTRRRANSCRFDCLTCKSQTAHLSKHLCKLCAAGNSGTLTYSKRRANLICYSGVEAAAHARY